VIVFPQRIRQITMSVGETFDGIIVPLNDRIEQAHRAGMRDQLPNFCLVQLNVGNI
jgi:hypothetical protein